MKKIYRAFMVLPVLLSKLLAQAPPEILYYNFNGTGTLVTNYASSPPAGTASGTLLGALTQSGTAGQCGSGALIGTGSASDYLNTNWGMSLTGSWSISFWSSNIGTSATLYYIFGDNSSFRCFTNGIAGASNWMLRCNGLTDMPITGGATLAAMHNVFVYDAVQGTGSMYLNGALQSTVAQTGTPSYSNATPFKVLSHISNVGMPSGGTLDEFRFYSRVLTPSEILQLYNGAMSSTTVNAVSCSSYTSPITASVYTATGVYTETYAATCGGTSTNNINLTINGAPALTVAASSPSVCSSAQVSLTASGTASSFTWSSGTATTSNVTVNPATSTIYTVTGGNAGCTTTKTIAVNVTPTPTLNYFGGSAVCIGSSATLTANGATSYSWNTNASTSTIVIAPTVNTGYTVTGYNGNCASTLTLSIAAIPTPTTQVSATSGTICSGTTTTLTASGAAIYGWSNGPISPSIAVAPAVSTNYVVIGVTNGCANSKTISITVNQTPTLTITPSSQTPCSGAMISLQASGANTYVWGDGLTSNPEVVTVTSSGIYSVTGLANSCYGLGIIVLNVFPTPVIAIAASATTVCEGSSVTFLASGGANYTWNNGSVSSILSVIPTSDSGYTVTGTNGDGCSASATASVAVNPTPTVTVSSSDLVVCKGNYATITASGATTYTWSNVTYNSSIVVSPVTSTTYSVTGKNTNGCTNSTGIEQKVDECVGVQQFSSDAGISVYPNPSNGVLNIQLRSASENTSIELYSATGQLLLSQKAATDLVVLNVQPIANGLYYLKIKNGNNLTVKQIAKE